MADLTIPENVAVSVIHTDVTGCCGTRYPQRFINGTEETVTRLVIDSGIHAEKTALIFRVEITPVDGDHDRYRWALEKALKVMNMATPPQPQELTKGDNLTITLDFGTKMDFAVYFLMHLNRFKAEYVE